MTDSHLDSYYCLGGSANVSWNALAVVALIKKNRNATLTDRKGGTSKAGKLKCESIWNTTVRSDDCLCRFHFAWIGTGPNWFYMKQLSEATRRLWWGQLLYNNVSKYDVDFKVLKLEWYRYVVFGLRYANFLVLYSSTRYGRNGWRWGSFGFSCGAGERHEFKYCSFITNKYTLSLPFIFYFFHNLCCSQQVQSVN